MQCTIRIRKAVAQITKQRQLRFPLQSLTLFPSITPTITPVTALTILQSQLPPSPTSTPLLLLFPLQVQLRLQARPQSSAVHKAGRAPVMALDRTAIRAENGVVSLPTPTTHPIVVTLCQLPLFTPCRLIKMRGIDSFAYHEPRTGPGEDATAICG